MTNIYLKDNVVYSKLGWEYIIEYKGHSYVFSTGEDGKWFVCDVKNIHNTLISRCAYGGNIPPSNGWDHNIDDDLKNMIVNLQEVRS